MKERTMPAWFFPRGPGPLVSICMATRNRVPHFLQAVDSLISLLRDPGNVELIIKIDDDDTETTAIVTSLKSRIRQPLEILSTPRGRGYADMGQWVNLMADRAKGDWLLFFNDDARMATQDWDFILMTLTILGCWHICPEDVSMVAVETNGSNDSNEFFFLRRKTYELLSRKFLTPYVDSWMYEVSNLVKSYYRTSLIKVNHLRETVRDDIRVNTDGVFAQSIASLIGSTPFLGQLSDCARLVEHIDYRTTQTRWYADAICPGWWFWKPSPIRNGIHVLVDNNKKIIASPAPDIVDASCKEVGGIWFPRVVPVEDKAKKW